jgi:hypothetical protein
MLVDDLWICLSVTGVAEASSSHPSPAQHFTPLQHFTGALTYRLVHTDILMETGTPHIQTRN